MNILRELIDPKQCEFDERIEALPAYNKRTLALRAKLRPVSTGALVTKLRDTIIALEQLEQSSKFSDASTFVVLPDLHEYLENALGRHTSLQIYDRVVKFLGFEAREETFISLTKALWEVAERKIKLADKQKALAERARKHRQNKNEYAH